MNKPPQPNGLDALRKAIIQQKTASLPEEEGKTVLFNELYRATYEYDQYVSQMVIGVVTQHEAAVPYERRELLQFELNKVLQIASPQQRRKVEQYKNYIDRLDRMLDLALQVSADLE